MIMASSRLSLSEEEMIVDEGLGYPLAYAKICRNVTHFNLYSTVPPLDFMPRSLSSQEQVGKAKDLNMLFPAVDHEGTPSVDPHGFVNLLWKQLAHLGNAGFDPVLFRVDQYGNVLYFHADPASPLYWSIDHWFPCSSLFFRTPISLPSNLRILQWQVFRKKHNKLEFLIPWWDLQLGISVNQFLSMFASRNSDFRNRAFSFLFKEGGNEKLNEGNVVDSHTFPHHFDGLAPDAIVASQRHQLRPMSHFSYLKSVFQQWHRMASVSPSKHRLLPPKLFELPGIETSLCPIDQKFRTQLIDDVYLSSRVIAFLTTSCANSTSLNYCHRVFLTISHPNMFIWNSMIRNYVHNDSPVQILQLYKQMIRRGFSSDCHTYPIVIRACTSLRAVITGETLHGLVFQHGFERDMYVVSGFTSFYASCELIASARELFDHMPEKDVVVGHQLFLGMLNLITVKKHSLYLKQ